MRPVRPRYTPSRESGAALTEFALVLPLFLAVIWGLTTLAVLARARLQLAVVSHAVAREAQAGLTETGQLTASAKAYGRACGMDRTAVESLRVELGSEPGQPVNAGTGAFSGLMAQAGGWTTIGVRARFRVPDGLRLLVGPVEMRARTTCLVGTWKAPWSMLSNLFKMPDPPAAKGT